MKTFERNEQRKFETECFSIPNTFPVAQKSFLLLSTTVRVNVDKKVLVG